MSGRTVRDVMTDMVVVVREDAGYKEIVDALVDFGVSAMPVVDGDGRVLGVVSEADLLHKVEFSDEDRQVRLFDRRRMRAAKEKAEGDLASELMTSPAVTIHPGDSIAAAARRMETERVKRLPVVDADGKLVGIVSRRDLLRVYLRPDPAIRAEIVNQVLRRTLAVEPSTMDIEVTAGVVRMTGKTDRRSTAEIAMRLVRAVDGVVDVVDELTYEYDDTADTHRRYVFDAGV
jgi:CBS domain-containing protein